MDRRAFLKWVGGGIAATVALSQSQVLDAQQLFGVTGEVDPSTLLWMPGEAKIVLPPDKPLVIVERQVGVACYRVAGRNGSYWYDEDWKFVDALGRDGQPKAILVDRYGHEDMPPVKDIRRYMRKTGPDTFVYDTWPYRRLEVSRWPGLLTPTERTIVAQVSAGRWKYEV